VQICQNPLNKMKYKKVLLLFPDYAGGHFGALRPPAGIGYLAQMLQEEGVEYDVLDMAAGGDLRTLKIKLLSFEPDLVAISLMSFMYKRSYYIINWVKEISSDITIVAGGPHISTLREKVLEECKGLDYGIVQEGERTLLELCKGLEVERILGLLYRKSGKVNYVGARPFEKNLDKFTFPRFEKFPLGKYVTEEIGIVSSRGCPFNCTYCPVKTSIGQQYRIRSAESIVDEITYWYNRGFKQISILDDNFTLNKERVLKICDAICKKEFKYIELNCNNGIRADKVDKEMLYAMKLAGFRYFAFGIESGNEQVLKNIKKSQDLDVIEKALKTAIELDFTVTLFFIVGSPGENMVQVKESIALAKKYPIFDARFYNLIPFPATELFEWAKKNKYLIMNPEEYLNNSSHWDYKPVFATPEFPVEERAKALVLTRQARKEIRYDAMKRKLEKKLGPFSGMIASFYINDWVQTQLMHNSFLRRNLKRLYTKASLNISTPPLLKSNKLNILIISSRSEGGGAEQFFKIMTKLNGFFKFYCALPDSPPYYDKIVNENISIFKLPYRKFKILAFLKLSKWVKANGITIVHSHGGGAGIYSRLLKLLNTKLKVVHTFHGIHSRSINRKVIVELLLKNLTDRFIFVSETERQIAMRLGITTATKSTLIENGIHIDNEIYNDIDRNSALQTFNKKISNESFVIGMLSRFDRIKNIPYAIRSLSDYLRSRDDVFLLIGGDGEGRWEIESAISEYNLQDKVILLGFINDNRRFFLLIDIYLNTSLGEAFGFSTVEAMKYGKPVVASKVYGNSDVVDDNETGLLFPLNKPSLLVEKIKILKDNQETYGYLSKKARENVKKHFNLDRMLNETRELYLSFTPDIRKKANMRIGINVSKACDVHTGVGRYTYNLRKSILKTNGRYDCHFYAPDRMNNTNGTDLEGIHLEKPTLIKQNNTLRILWEQIMLPIHSRKDRLDLFHYTDHALSLFQRVHPTVITVHDIAYVRFPHMLNKSRQIYKKGILRISIENADIIVADSYSTKRDIIEYYGTNEEKIKVVHLGVESRFRPISNVEEYRQKNKLPSKMILNVGTLEPRKNVITLIKAYKKLREKGFEDYKLVVAGDRGWLYKQIFKEVGHSGLEQEIFFLGVVMDQDLPMLYNCADIFVYPSLYEGFGLPPLEAMACGIPVITSNTSSLPEVIGDAGIMVDPTDVNSLCESMYLLLKDKELWNRMSNMGRERSKLFSWERAAKEILEIYDGVLSV
jgi:anaerobic magnesium-protoporphyrin IX monomethyl ester cyclase